MSIHDCEIPNIDITTYPPVNPRLKKREDGLLIPGELTITIGDSHANLFKVLYTAIYEGIITGITPKDYKDLQTLTQIPASQLTTENWQSYLAILKKIVIDPASKIKFVLDGDVVNDRFPGGDHFMFQFLETLTTAPGSEKLDLEIIAGNHDYHFLYWYQYAKNKQTERKILESQINELSLNTALSKEEIESQKSELQNKLAALPTDPYEFSDKLLLGQENSRYALCTVLKNKVISHEKLDQWVDLFYSKLKLFSHSEGINEDCSQRLMLTTHARAGLNTLQETAKRLEAFPENFEATAQGYCDLSQAVHQKFQSQMSNENIQEKEENRTKFLRTTEEDESTAKSLEEKDTSTTNTPYFNLLFRRRYHQNAQHDPLPVTIKAKKDSLQEMNLFFQNGHVGQARKEPNLPHATNLDKSNLGQYKSAFSTKDIEIKRGKPNFAKQDSGYTILKPQLYIWQDEKGKFKWKYYNAFAGRTSKPKSDYKGTFPSNSEIGQLLKKNTPKSNIEILYFILHNTSGLNFTHKDNLTYIASYSYNEEMARYLYSEVLKDSAKILNKKANQIEKRWVSFYSKATNQQAVEKAQEVARQLNTLAIEAAGSISTSARNLKEIKDATDEILKKAQEKYLDEEKKIENPLYKDRIFSPIIRIIADRLYRGLKSIILSPMRIFSPTKEDIASTKPAFFSFKAPPTKTIKKIHQALQKVDTFLPVSKSPRV